MVASIQLSLLLLLMLLYGGIAQTDVLNKRLVEINFLERVVERCHIDVVPPRSQVLCSNGGSPTRSMHYTTTTTTIIITIIIIIITIAIGRVSVAMLKGRIKIVQIIHTMVMI